ncbi:MAG: aldo/keto reductase [Anaerolineaceae bacterium]|nr:aldo/keto reductase [Anaerolineaceae bacterium]
MEYRRMGKAGLKLSELSLGAWVTYGGQVGEEIALECMKAAYDNGVNFFDNAEAYAGGQAEIVMGNVLKKMDWQRESYVVSTKIFWGGKGPNDSGLSYKHIIEGTNKALKRLQLDYVDLVYCHRPDSQTPIEETVWGMDQVIRQGKAFYWGTSEWSAADIMQADKIARQNGLRPPSMEQPQYNMLHRERFEVEYRPIFRDLGYGTTIYSPLKAGILTGKYSEGIPEGSRLGLDGLEWLKQSAYIESDINKVKRLLPISDELGCTLAQLALAWCLKNPDVSTVITGASKASQVYENMKAVEIAPKLTEDVMEMIEEILDNKPQYKENFR